MMNIFRYSSIIDISIILYHLISEVTVEDEFYLYQAEMCQVFSYPKRVDI